MQDFLKGTAAQLNVFDEVQHEKKNDDQAWLDLMSIPTRSRHEDVDEKEARLAEVWIDAAHSSGSPGQPEFSGFSGDIRFDKHGFQRTPGMPKYFAPLPWVLPGCSMRFWRRV